jgi:hypothetical protein
MSKTKTAHIRQTEASYKGSINVGVGDEARAKAEEIAASFPKYVRVFNSTLSTFVRGEYGRTAVVETVIFQADLRPNKNKGEVNEAGLKRIAAFERGLDKLGIAIDSDETKAKDEVQAILIQAGI